MIALAALLRHWPIGLATAGLIFATFAHVGRLKAEAAMEQAKAEMISAHAQVERQQEAIETMRRDGARRAAIQQDQLKAARGRNQAETPLVERLRQSAGQPRGGEDCAISEALRRAEGKL